MRTITLMLVLLPVAGRVAADEVETAWRVDFDDQSKIGGVRYVRRGEDHRDTGMIFRIADGTLTFGAGHASGLDGDKWDRAVLAWGKCMPYGFWQWPASPFEPIDVARFPVIELRTRRVPDHASPICLTPVFDTDAGTSFTQMGIALEDDWQVTAIRFSPLSSVPGPRTPRKLIGLVFLVQPGDKPSAFEIDWIRVRSFTPEESARDEVITSNLRRYQVPAWKQDFFPYGPYGPSIRGTARQGGFEGAYGNIVRANMNAILCTHDLSYYRFRGKPGKTQDECVRDFLSVNRKAVEAAKRAGLRLSLDVRGFDKDLGAHGREYVIPAIRMVADAFRDEPTVFGYTVSDEPQTNRIWDVVGIKQIFEERDPTKLCSFALADALWAPDFEPYSTVHVGDRYPILASRRRCEEVADQMDGFNKATDKPVWFIIQAHADRSWWTENRSSYRMPTEAEFLRTAFMALGRGAKGLFIYDWYHRPFVCLTDRFGNPGPLYEVAKRLGERLAGVGPVLLRCRVDSETTAKWEKVGRGSEHFEVLPLEMLEPPGVLFVACNSDLMSSRTLSLSLGDGRSGQVLMEMATLSVGPPDKLRATEVGPGDGRLFALLDKGDAASLEKEILVNRRGGAKRAGRPDRVIAERWAEAPREMAKLGRILDACAVRLEPLQRALLTGVDKPKPGKEVEWKRCYALGLRYDRLRARWIAADEKDLAGSIDRLNRDVTALCKQLGINN